VGCFRVGGSYGMVSNGILMFDKGNTRWGIIQVRSSRLMHSINIERKTVRIFDFRRQLIAFLCLPLPWIG